MTKCIKCGNNITIHKNSPYRMFCSTKCKTRWDFEVDFIKVDWDINKQLAIDSVRAGAICQRF